MVLFPRGFYSVVCSNRGVTCNGLKDSSDMKPAEYLWDVKQKQVSHTALEVYIPRLSQSALN